MSGPIQPETYYQPIGTYYVTHRERFRDADLSLEVREEDDGTLTVRLVKSVQDSVQKPLIIANIEP